MAKLEQIAGAGTGKNIELEQQKVILGRHPKCDIVVDASAVSRYHAQITKRGASFFVEDLGSRNGTFINEQVVSEPIKLRHNDNIRICDVVYSYRSDAPLVPDHSTAVVIQDDNPDAVSSIMSRFDMTMAGSVANIHVGADVKLAAVLEITNALGRTLSLSDILPPVLESLFKVFAQAERGFMILKDAGNNIDVPYSHFRHANDGSVSISRTIVYRAMDSRQAILSADAATDSRFSLTESIAQVQIRSFMCVPLIDNDDIVVGVIQIDTLDANRRFTDSDLEILAGLAPLIAKAIQTAQLHDEMLAQRALQRDLELAQQVQIALLPQKQPDIAGWEFFDHYRAANIIGGDYFDYVPLSGGRVGVIVADVSGHGIAAALIMTKLSAEAKFCLAANDNPADVVARLNTLMCDDAVEDRFVTMVLLVISPNDGTVRMANAGHLCPVLRDTNGKTVDVADFATGLPLGVMDGFEYESATFEMKPGEIVTLVTDGITEATDKEDEEMYGLDRMRKSCQRMSDRLDEYGSLIVQDVQQFGHFAAQGDDICVVCMKRK